MRARALLLPGESFLRQIGEDGVSQFLVNLHRLRIVSELVSVDQAAGKLVVGVGRQADNPRRTSPSDRAFRRIPSRGD